MTIPTDTDDSPSTIQCESPEQDTGSNHTPEQASDSESLPVKVCPHCSVQSQTMGNFCPHCAGSYSGPRPHSKFNKRIVLVVVAALVVIGSVTGLALKISRDKRVAAQLVATAQAQKRASDAAQVTADAATAAVAVKQAADDQTRAERVTSVAELEAAILKDAKERVKSQTLTGPMLSASCTPLGGGSADDLTSLTGTFECIAVNKTNADGTSSGYRFSGTINWGKDYTWHLGS